jgi:hypothetical protein
VCDSHLGETKCSLSFSKFLKSHPLVELDTRKKIPSTINTRLLRRLSSHGADSSLPLSSGIEYLYATHSRFPLFSFVSQLPLASLRTFEFHSFSITASEELSLSTALQQAPSLTSLTWSFAGGKNTRTASSLAQLITKSKTLTSVNLDHLDDLDVTPIVIAIPKSVVIEFSLLKLHALSSKDLSTMTQTWPESRLERLSLDVGTEEDSPMLEFLTAVAKKMVVTIRSLYGRPQRWSRFLQVLPRTSVVSLQFGQGNQFEISELVTAIKSSPHLTHLDCLFRPFSTEELKELFKAMPFTSIREARIEVDSKSGEQVQFGKDESCLEPMFESLSRSPLRWLQLNRTVFTHKLWTWLPRTNLSEFRLTHYLKDQVGYPDEIDFQFPEDFFCNLLGVGPQS